MNRLVAVLFDRLLLQILIAGSNTKWNCTESHTIFFDLSKLFLVAPVRFFDLAAISIHIIVIFIFVRTTQMPPQGPAQRKTLRNKAATAVAGQCYGDTCSCAAISVRTHHHTLHSSTPEWWSMRCTILDSRHRHRSERSLLSQRHPVWIGCFVGCNDANHRNSNIRTCHSANAPSDDVQIADCGDISAVCSSKAKELAAITQSVQVGPV